MSTKKHNEKYFLVIIAISFFLLVGCTTKKADPEPIIQVIDPNDIIREPVGIVTTEAGEKVDLAALKAQYGDLYRFIEPMTTKEINEQFEQIAELVTRIVAYNASKNDKTKVVHVISVTYVDETSDDYWFSIKDFTEQMSLLFSTFHGSSDPSLNKFALSHLEDQLSKQFNSTLTDEFMINIYDKKSITIYSLLQKEIIVRDFKALGELMIKVFRDRNYSLGESAVDDLNKWREDK